MTILTTKTDKKLPLQALTGVRFLAAFLVVALHFAEPKNPSVKDFVGHGFIGVTLFFVLSGFILSYTYSLAPGKMKGTAWSFLAARFSRIFPMYLISLVLATPVVLYWSTLPNPYLPALASLSLTQAWLPFAMREWNPPGWSLSAEAFFYILFPFAITRISRLSCTQLLNFSAICWVASLTAPLVYLVNGSINLDFWMFNPLVRLPEFLLGVAVGVIWLKNRSQLRLPKYLADISFVILIAVLCLPVHNAYLINGVCSPLIVAIIIGLAENRGIMARILSTRFFVILGSASYSLYILHWPLWYEASFITRHLNLNIAPNHLFWLISITVLIPASYIFWRFIEEPMSKYLRGRLTSTMPSKSTHLKDDLKSQEQL